MSSQILNLLAAIQLRRGHLIPTQSLLPRRMDDYCSQNTVSVSEILMIFRAACKAADEEKENNVGFKKASLKETHIQDIQCNSLGS